MSDYEHCLAVLGYGTAHSDANAGLACVSRSGFMRTAHLIKRIDIFARQNRLLAAALKFEGGDLVVGPAGPALFLPALASTSIDCAGYRHCVRPDA